MSGNPWFSWTYVVQNAGTLLEYAAQHVSLTVQAVVVAAAIAIPLGVLVAQVRRLSGIVVGTASVLYTLPSLAVFAMLAPILGIGRTPVLVGLVIYALLVIMRNTIAGVEGVDHGMIEAARAIGLGSVRTLWHVTLPNAIPSVVAGLRLATVQTVALATIGVVVGYGGLGQLMFQGFRNNFYRAEITAAAMACVLLALLLDAMIWFLGRAATPWTRRYA